MSRRTALREINEKTLDLLVTALRKLKNDNAEDFSARDISELTGKYVLPKTIENSIDNDRGGYNSKKRLSLIGKALMKAFPGKTVRLKRSCSNKRETVVYTSDDGERFEKIKYVYVYHFFSYDD